MAGPFPNPPVNVNALLVPMTADVVNQVIIQNCVTLGLRADLWPQEGTLRSCMYAIARVISGFINDGISARKAGWLPTAFGNWLTWLAFYMYGVLRTPGTFAGGALTLVNGGGGAFAFLPFTASFQCSATQKTYKNVDAIALGPLGTQTIAIQADELGSASNAPPLGIDTILSSMRAVTCKNLSAVIGVDPQSDPSLQLECWNAIAANSAYGPRQSFGYAVQNAINPISFAPVNVNRWRTSPSSHTGQVTVTVASPAGAADPNDVVGVANKVEAIARPECVQVTVQSATPVPYAASLTAYVNATPGLDAGDVESAMAAALIDYFGSSTANPIGGQRRPTDGFSGVFGSAIDAVVGGAWPPRPTDPTVPWQSAVFDVDGASDLALLAQQVATNAVTVTAVLVAQP